MMNYAWFLGTIIVPLTYCIISWPVVMVKMFITKQITDEMRSLPIYVYVVIGFLDSIGTIFLTISSPFVSGPLQIVLNQFIIPCTMVLSMIFLKTRYRLLHLIAVLYILAGVVSDMLPSLFSLNSGLSQEISYSFLILASVIPQAASNIFKERELKKKDMDVWYFNAWVATFQLMIGIATMPMVFNKFLAGGKSVPPSQIGGYILQSLKCFGGINSQTDDDCSEVPYVFSVYMCFNLVFNIFSLYILKYGSATLATVASSLRIALSAFAFQFAFISGKKQKNLTAFDFVSVFILVLGVAVYRIKKEKKQRNTTLMFRESQAIRQNQPDEEDSLFNSLDWGSKGYKIFGQESEEEWNTIWGTF